MKEIKVQQVPFVDGYRWEEVFTGQRFDDELDARRQAAEHRENADYFERVAGAIREATE